MLKPVSIGAHSVIQFPTLLGCSPEELAGLRPHLLQMLGPHLGETFAKPWRAKDMGSNQIKPFDVNLFSKLGCWRLDNSTGQQCHSGGARRLIEILWLLKHLDYQQDGPGCWELTSSTKTKNCYSLTDAQRRVML